MTSIPSIARYLSVQSAYTPSFCSDGERITFLSDITGVPQVWQVRLPEPGSPPLWPEQLTFEANRVQAVMCSPAPGDNRVIYARDVGGNENAQLFLLDAVTGDETTLTAGYDAAMHIPGPWSPDGTFILFAANRRNPGLFDIYMQPLDGDARLVWQNDRPGFLLAFDLAPDLSRATALLMAGSFDMQIYEIDLQTGDARHLTPDSHSVRYHGAYYAADGQSLYVVTDRDSDFMNLMLLDLQTMTWQMIHAPGWDVEELGMAPDRQQVAYTVNIDGASDLYVLDLAQGERRVMPRIDESMGMVVAGWLSFAPDASRIALTYTSDTRTQDNYVWDLTTNAVYQVTRSSHGGLDRSTFVGAELIHYPTFDTGENGEPRQIPAWFHRPTNPVNEPMPVIVMVHGGPEGQSRPQFLFNVQYFLQQGYAVLRPNVRGSVGYGKAYSHLDDVEKRMDSVADLAYAAAWLKEQPGIDGNRLVVYGGSYGGFMVLSAVTTYPDLWVAGIDIVGICNFVTFLENTSDYRRAHREAEYGSLAHDRAFLERISPINHVDQVTAPVMVLHGANDPRVPLGEAEQFAAALKDRDVPVELLVFDDEGHGIVKLKNKLVAYPAIMEFLRTHV